MNLRIITKYHAVDSKIGSPLEIDFRADWTHEAVSTAWELKSKKHMMVQKLKFLSCESPIISHSDISGNFKSIKLPGFPVSLPGNKHAAWIFQPTIWRTPNFQVLISFSCDSFQKILDFILVFFVYFLHFIDNKRPILKQLFLPSHSGTENWRGPSDIVFIFVLTTFSRNYFFALGTVKITIFTTFFAFCTPGLVWLGLF